MASNPVYPYMYPWPTLPAVYQQPRVGAPLSPVVVPPPAPKVVPGSSEPPVPAQAPKAPAGAGSVTRFMTSLRDPRVMSFLLSAAQGLTQPRGPGVTGASQVVNAIVGGYRGLAAARALQQQQAAAYREELQRREAAKAGIGQTKAQTKVLKAEAGAIPERIKVAKDRIAESAREFNVGNDTQVKLANKRLEVESKRVQVLAREAAVAEQNAKTNAQNAAAQQKFEAARLRLQQEMARYQRVAEQTRLTIAKQTLARIREQNGGQVTPRDRFLMRAKLAQQIYDESQFMGEPLSREEASKAADDIVQKAEGSGSQTGSTTGRRVIAPGQTLTVDLYDLDPTKGHQLVTITPEQYMKLTPETQKLILTHAK